MRKSEKKLEEQKRDEGQWLPAKRRRVIKGHWWSTSIWMMSHKVTKESENEVYLFCKDLLGLCWRESAVER